MASEVTQTWSWPLDRNQHENLSLVSNDQRILLLKVVEEMSKRPEAMLLGINFGGYDEDMKYLYTAVVTFSL